VAPRELAYACKQRHASRRAACAGCHLAHHRHIRALGIAARTAAPERCEKCKSYKITIDWRADLGGIYVHLAYLVGSHIVIYRVGDDKIGIVRILHEHEPPQARLAFSAREAMDDRASPRTIRRAALAAAGLGKLKRPLPAAWCAAAASPRMVLGRLPEAEGGSKRCASRIFEGDDWPCASTGSTLPSAPPEAPDGRPGSPGGISFPSRRADHTESGISATAFVLKCTLRLILTRARRSCWATSALPRKVRRRPSGLLSNSCASCFWFLGNEPLKFIGPTPKASWITAEAGPGRRDDVSQMQFAGSTTGARRGCLRELLFTWFETE
jgi:hypothetical protein